MNLKRIIPPLFVVAMIMLLTMSACGTLRIESEPVAVPLQPAATATVNAEPTEVIEETSVTPTAPVDAEVVADAAADSVTSSDGDPGGELLTYANSEYGFHFNYPATWTVAEVDGDDYVGPGSRSVQLSQGTVKLVIGYRRVGEGVAIGGSGAPGGEFEIRGTVHVAGQDVERHVVIFEGKDKAVMYGQPGIPITAAGLEFAPRLHDFGQVAYEDVELSQSVQDEADLILSSLTITESEPATTGDAVEHDDAGWLPYANEALGYSLLYPGNADIMGANRDESVEFVGPIDGSDHWPWLSVQHFDSRFYSPPPGTDVGQWIADSNISYASDAQPATIGGLPAVHLRVESSPQAYGMDEYYVINGGQLYKITILHTGGLEDWALYDRFLQSFAFGEPQL